MGKICDIESLGGNRQNKRVGRSTSQCEIIVTKYTIVPAKVIHGFFSQPGDWMQDIWGEI